MLLDVPAGGSTGNGGGACALAGAAVISVVVAAASTEPASHARIQGMTYPPVIQSRNPGTCRTGSWDATPCGAAATLSDPAFQVLSTGSAGSGRVIRAPWAASRRRRPGQPRPARVNSTLGNDRSCANNFVGYRCPQCTGSSLCCPLLNGPVDLPMAAATTSTSTSRVIPPTP